jgi:hypothetical protein
MRFDGGYKEFREKSGRGSDPVNFTLSGNTTGKRFRIVKRSRGLVIVGWPAGSTQAVVAAGLDEREDGQAFAWSPDEQQVILDDLRAAIAVNLGKAGVPLTPEEVTLTQAVPKKGST